MKYQVLEQFIGSMLDDGHDAALSRLSRLLLFKIVEIDSTTAEFD